MRLVVSNSMKTWGGGENWSLTAAEGLARRGHEVLLACRPDSELLRRAGKAGGLVEPLPVMIRGDINPFVTLRMAGLMSRRRIQAVCCNLDREVRSLGVAARIVGVPFVRRRGSDYGFKNSPRYRVTYRHLVNRIIVNSESTRRSILAKNPWLDPSKLVRIYNGIDTGYFRPDPDEGAGFRRTLGLGREDRIIGMVGSLLPRKRHITLFRALPALVGRHPGLCAVVAGPSPSAGHLEALKRAADELGAAESVRFIGPVDDLRACYNSFDILCMPSENEGFGYAAAEAMSCGIPVVVSDASSLPEVVGPDGGITVPLDDHEALAEALDGLLSDPAGRAALGEAGRRRVETLFSVERMIDDLEVFFDGLCKGSEGG